MTARKPSLETRAATVKVRRPNGGHDRRTATAYTAALAWETERSLRQSANWRAGRPLDAGERWPHTAATDGGLGGRARLAARRDRA